MAVLKRFRILFASGPLYQSSADLHASTVKPFILMNSPMRGDALGLALGFGAALGLGVGAALAAHSSPESEESTKSGGYIIAC